MASGSWMHDHSRHVARQVQATLTLHDGVPTSTGQRSAPLIRTAHLTCRSSTACCQLCCRQLLPRYAAQVPVFRRHVPASLLNCSLQLLCFVLLQASTRPRILRGPLTVCVALAPVSNTSPSVVRPHRFANVLFAPLQPWHTGAIVTTSLQWSTELQHPGVSKRTPAASLSQAIVPR